MLVGISLMVIGVLAISYSFYHLLKNGSIRFLVTEEAHPLPVDGEEEEEEILEEDEEFASVNKKERCEEEEEMSEDWKKKEEEE